MLVIDNKVIETPISELVELLRQQLCLNHIDKLSKLEYKQNNIRVICPIHSNGHERTPSCDILLIDKGDVPAGTVHCFGCGYKASFLKFVADCLDTSFRKASEWILSVSRYSLRAVTRDIDDIDLPDTNVKQKEEKIVSLEELKSYDYIHPYMFKRKLTDEVIQKFEVGYDPKLDAITFPVYVNGKCRFVCKRYVSYKRFDMPKDIVKPVYGADYLTNCSDVYVCESVINALTLWSWGYEAVALFGIGTEYQIDILKKLNQRKFILCLDGDEAGRKGTKKLYDSLDNKLVFIKVIPEGKDVNDLTKEEFDELEENF